jgi:hypothetical protein
MCIKESHPCAKADPSISSAIAENFILSAHNQFMTTNQSAGLFLRAES